MAHEKTETHSMPIPRLLGYLDWIYLREALKATDTYFEDALSKTNDENEIKNINATRQTLYRASFISICATIEQSLDERVRLQQQKQKKKISPSDLKHRGIKRSIVYANKVLERNIDIKKQCWKDAELLQELRNKLVHDGPGFPGKSENKKLCVALNNTNYVSFNPGPYFSREQLNNTIDLFKECLRDYRESKSA